MPAKVRFAGADAAALDFAMDPSLSLGLGAGGTASDRVEATAHAFAFIAGAVSAWVAVNMKWK